MEMKGYKHKTDHHHHHNYIHIVLLGKTKNDISKKKTKNEKIEHFENYQKNSKSQVA